MGLLMDLAAGQGTDYYDGTPPPMTVVSRTILMRLLVIAAGWRNSTSTTRRGRIDLPQATQTPSLTTPTSSPAKRPGSTRPGQQQCPPLDLP